MLTTSDLRHWVTHFGVSEHQVRRDHLVSHVLAALGQLDLDTVFFGGTALCRTHLPNWRLSEDVDLLAADPNGTGQRIEDELPRLLRREYPGATVTLRQHDRGLDGAIESAGLEVRIQVVALGSSYRRYPTRAFDVLLRYGDLPPSTVLRAPTATSAAAMKLNAWMERGAPRDLCDLFGLAERGMLDENAVSLAADVGWSPARWMFSDERTPTIRTWEAALGHQMADLPDPAHAISVVGAHVLQS